MYLKNPAVLALILSASLNAQTVPDLSTATPVPGAWTYARTSDGSEASFVDATARPQLIIHCTHSSRHVSIAKPAAAPSPTLTIWTSSQQRSVASGFNPATGRVVTDFEAYDTLLDAMSNSRGRLGVSVAAQPALVLPPWPEIARVVEDCRA